MFVHPLSFRNALLGGLLGLGIQVASAQPPARDVSGIWKLSWMSRDLVAHQAIANFQETGTAITGSLSVNGHSLPLHGNIHGPQIDFVAQNFFRRVAFAGVVSGNNMAGETDEKVKWSAIRN